MSEIDKLIRIAKESLTRVVAEGDDFMPMLLVEADGILTVVALAIDEDPVAYIPVALAIYRDQTVTSVSFTSDSFYVSDPTVPRPYQTAFFAGDPRVSEALSIVLVTTDETTQALVPYTRMSDKTVEWSEEVKHTGDGVGGRVTEYLRSAIRGES